jgi:cell wall assembly regulator SMI1
MLRETLLEFTGVELRSAATEDAVALVEERLGQSLPQALRSLLEVSDGISAEYGVEFVWSASRILAENISLRDNEQFRSLYMPFDPLLL